MPLSSDVQAVVIVRKKLQNTYEEPDYIAHKGKTTDYYDNTNILVSRSLSPFRKYICTFLLS
jgi:hypothetical protein